MRAGPANSPADETRQGARGRRGVERCRQCARGAARRRRGAARRTHLRGLEAAGGVQAVPELEELQRRHRLEDGKLPGEQGEDVAHALQARHGAGQRARGHARPAHRRSETGNVGQALLEPQLGRLVRGDKQQPATQKGGGRKEGRQGGGGPSDAGVPPARARAAPRRAPRRERAAAADSLVRRRRQRLLAGKQRA